MKKKSKGTRVKQLTSLISQEWIIRIVSLFLAVVLWIFVGGENRVDKNIMVPVEIINLPQNLVVSNQYKKEIEVSVSGPRSLIENMEKNTLRQVDLTKARPGTLVVEHSNDTINVPRGVTVQRIQPSSVILSLDKLIKKKVPILVRTIGQVESGYFLKSKKTSPDIITITGPETTLQGVEKIFTKPVNLTGMFHTSQPQTPLDLSSQLIDLIGETSVTVVLEIRPDAETVTVEVPVEASVDGEKVTVKPAVVRVVAIIPKVLLGQQKNTSSLLQATAVGKEKKEDLHVVVRAQQDVSEPIEIVSISPSVSIS